MEEELREAFREVREATERGFERMGLKVDAVRSDLHSHTVESTSRAVQIDGRARSAHHRMDEHFKEHANSDNKEEVYSGRRWELIVALAVAVASGLGTLAVWVYQLAKKAG